MTDRSASAVSLEVFVLNQLSTIAQELSSRGAQKAVRDDTLRLLGEPCSRAPRSAVPPLASCGPWGSQSELSEAIRTAGRAPSSRRCSLAPRRLPPLHPPPPLPPSTPHLLVSSCCRGAGRGAVWQAWQPPERAVSERCHCAGMQLGSGGSGQGRAAPALPLLLLPATPASTHAAAANCMQLLD